MNNRLVCLCNMISEKEILEVLKKGASTTEHIQKITGAGTSCGRCLPVIDQLVDQYNFSNTKDGQIELDVLTSPEPNFSQKYTQV